MRLNLIRNGVGVMTGYINVDPLAIPDENAEVVMCDHSSLDDIVSDAEATEIIALDVVDFISYNAVQQTIEHWVKKLRHGGRISIGGIDMFEVAKSLVNFSHVNEKGERLNKFGQIDAVNRLLHNVGGDVWDLRQANFSGFFIADLLRHMGLKIISQRVVGFKYCVEAERV